MKNKKIFSRVLALVGVAVLMFALAVPCFADDTDDADSGYVAFNDYVDSVYYDNVAYDNLLEVIGSDVMLNDCLVVGTVVSDVVPYEEWSAHDETMTIECNAVSVHGYDSLYSYTHVSGEGAYYWVLYFDVTGENVKLRLDDNSVGATIMEILFSYDYEDDVLKLQDVMLYEYDANYEVVETYSDSKVDIAFTFDNSNVVEGMNVLTNMMFVSGDGSIYYPKSFYSGYVMNADGSSVPPTRSGMFGQLYYILRDAIFGDGVVLDGIQDFSLTLVTTLLVFATVLLPVLLVIAIMFRLFRW